VASSFAAAELVVLLKLYSVAHWVMQLQQVIKMLKMA